MRSPLIPISIFLLSSLPSAGQNFAYAFTYSKPGSLTGTTVRLVDLHSGQTVRSLYQEGQSYQISGAKGSRIARDGDAVLQKDTSLLPMATSVAAAAYDQVHNRLFYTPLGIDQLRYIDLRGSKLPAFNYITGQEFGVCRGIFDVPSQITRMVISPDGFGYALSNDGDHLLRFTTDENIKITDLGEVTDNPANTTVSIHSLCSSTGGDMVSTVTGELILVTAYNHVFSIDPATKIATYQGMIAGLPAGFTSNGAAVDDEGDLVVCCATESPDNAYYKVDMKSLKASRVSGVGSVVAASDLANSNLLGQSAEARRLFGDNSKASLANPGRVFSIYPSPVTDGYLNMSLTNFAKGTYQVQIQDLAGRNIKSWSVDVNKVWQVERIDIGSYTSQGVYVIRLYDKVRSIFFIRQFMVTSD
jgi:hypothetical protein